MKKISLIISSFVILSVLALSAKPLHAADFRKNYWGDSMSDVIAKEGPANSKYSDSDNLIYLSTLLGRKVVIGFNYYKGKLFMAQYVFRDNYYNKWLGEFDKIDDVITKKYGKGEYDIKWKNNTYKKMKKYYNLAIQLGHVQVRKIWEMPKLRIVLLLNSSNGKSVTFKLMYVDKKNYDRIMKEKKGKTQSNDI